MGSGKSQWKRYPAMKDSGIEWLGEIPEGWRVKRLKHAAEIQLGKMLQPEAQAANDTLANYLRAANIQVNGVQIDDVKQMWISPSQKSKYLLVPGDILVSEGGDVGRSCVYQGEVAPCYFQNSINRLRSTPESAAGYIYYWMVYLKEQGYVDMVCNKATIGHFTAEKVRDAPHVLPPLAEQKAIAAFLDRETARIDKLIEKKERLIELLKEKRQAMISQAVTKGLDPQAKMKDSGIEWLGQIPEGWEVKRLGKISTSLQTGPFGSQLHSDEYIEGGVPVINPSHLQDGQILPDEAVSIDEHTFQRLQYYSLEEGDIVFARRGEMGRCGLVVRGQSGWLCGTGSLRVRLRKDVVLPSFVNTFISLNGVKEWLSLNSVGSTMENLNTSILGRVPVLLPPIVQQSMIVDRLGAESNRLQELVVKVESHIVKLREYRQALISAAVTGKIDVRDEVV